MGTTTAEMTDAAWRERDALAVAQVYSRYSNIVVDHAQGSHLYTTDGRDVLDFGSGIAVSALGHLHPDVVAAVHKQVDRLWHTSTTSYHTQIVAAAEALLSITPKGVERVFFGNSGAEAVEAAIKVTRRRTGRSEIIAFDGAFHGRTYGAVTLTASKAKYHAGIGPFLPGVHHVPYPYCFRTCSHAANEPCPIAAGQALDTLFSIRVDPESVAAIFVEPILGEGGYVVPPEGFLKTLRSYCDRYGILLVVDEVQSGMFRTGKPFAVDYEDVRPDVVLVAKALGNGMPISAMVASNDVMSAWHAGEHGTTYGGNPISCAAAMAVIEVMERDRLGDRAVSLGAHVTERVRGWQKDHPKLADVRGKGLMIGLEFMDDAHTGATKFVEQVQHRAIDNGVLLLTCGRDDNVIRLIPPLTISEGDLDHGLELLERSISQAEESAK